MRNNMTNDALFVKLRLKKPIDQWS